MSKYLNGDEIIYIIYTKFETGNTWKLSIFVFIYNMWTPSIAIILKTFMQNSWFPFFDKEY